jgi:hypothetical protein
MSDCGSLDQLLQAPRTGGGYPVHVLSNQPDGIVGYGGALRWNGSAFQGTMQGPTGTNSPGPQGYLFSDRLLNGPVPPQPPFQGPPQGFALRGAEPIAASVQRLGGGSYRVHLQFTGPVNRTFDFTGQCVGSAVVGTAPAIGSAEGDSALARAVGRAAAGRDGTPEQPDGQRQPIDKDRGSSGPEDGGRSRYGTCAPGPGAGAHEPAVEHRLPAGAPALS